MHAQHKQPCSIVHATHAPSLSLPLAATWQCTVFVVDVGNQPGRISPAGARVCRAIGGHGDRLEAKLAAAAAAAAGGLRVVVHGVCVCVWGCWSVVLVMEAFESVRPPAAQRYARVQRERFGGRQRWRRRRWQARCCGTRVGLGRHVSFLLIKTMRGSSDASQRRDDPFGADVSLWRRHPRSIPPPLSLSRAHPPSLTFCPARSERGR